MQAQTSSFQPSSSSTTGLPQAATPSTVPPPAPTTPAPDDGKLRRSVLSDTLIHVAMRGVIRKRGVREQDVEDVLNTVIADMMDDEKIPLHDHAQAKTYLCTCASNCSISLGRKRKRWSRIVPEPKKGEEDKREEGGARDALELLPRDRRDDGARAA